MRSARFNPRHRPFPRSLPALALLGLFAFFAFAVLGTPTAHADEEQLDRLERLSKKAMESFDLLDYEAAKKLLNAAVEKAGDAGLENNPLLAKIHLNLGIVYFAGESDKDSARAAFVKAVTIDEDIEIDPAYRTDDMQSLLDEVKEELAASGDSGSAVDCSSVEGLSHELIDTAPLGTDLQVQVLLGADLEADKVALHYRFHGIDGASPEFNELDMAGEGCMYTASIPGAEITGGVIHYYVAAYQGGDLVASKGNERTPNIIEVTAAGDGTDSDDPLGGKSDEPAGPDKFLLSVAAGTGGAFVTGETEQLLAPVNAGFAPALLHVQPEFGYYLNPKTSISAAFRLGFTLGANRDQRATTAPAAIIRWRQALGDSAGEGPFWSAAIGGGVVRQIVELTDIADETMNVDTTAIGPLLVGGGAGYALPLGGKIRFVAELNTLIGVPVIGQLGNAQVNFGVQFDLNLALVVAM